MDMSKILPTPKTYLYRIKYNKDIDKYILYKNGVEVCAVRNISKDVGTRIYRLGISGQRQCLHIQDTDIDIQDMYKLIKYTGFVPPSRISLKVKKCKSQYHNWSKCVAPQNKISPVYDEDEKIQHLITSFNISNFKRENN